MNISCLIKPHPSIKFSEISYAQQRIHHLWLTNYDLNFTAYKSPDIICSSEGRKFENVAECIKEAKSGFVSALTSKNTINI